MSDDEFITPESFCSYYQVELNFLEMLESHGLIAFSYRENQRLIAKEEVAELERFSRMYYELSINVPGIDALKNLLEKIKELQQEAEKLKARLRIYE
jgi:chaperone modulatory protein CbpM